MRRLKIDIEPALAGEDIWVQTEISFWGKETIHTRKRIGTVQFNSMFDLIWSDIGSEIKQFAKENGHDK